MKTHLALVVEENEGAFSHSLQQQRTPAPKEKEVLIKVSHSSLNYKDFLSLTGNKGVTRHYPHTPGIDAAGEIAETRSEHFAKGEAVIVIGYDLGMNTSGGFQEYIAVPENWVVSLKGLSLNARQAMAWGTAGFTAAQSVEKIADASPTSSLPIAVTGATGGVGSVAVMLLAKLGYSVHALTRSVHEEPRLKKWGADEVINASSALNPNEVKKPFLKPIYGGGVDTVGGAPLSYLLRSATHRSTVTTCGMVAGIGLNLTVFPFILRGITLAGIDSAECPIDKKRKLWQRIANEWSLPMLTSNHEVIALNEVGEMLMAMGEGKSVARVVVAIAK